MAIIGCGLIGAKRSAALGTDRLVATADKDIARAERLSDSAHRDWQEVVRREDVDIVIVATTNDMLAEISLAAVEAGKHVLVEKPAARNAKELNPLVKAAQQKKVCVKVGFNHRFHPAMLKAKEIFDSGEIGELMFIRGRYGHGGRLGYEKEWRADPKISGGGELLDQGVHLIDLSRWFAAQDFSHVWGRAGTFFWNM
ncbi:MAG TPA: Gfo/Idh/MocA family oxidoreductase, partial [Tepidisphaeraceae bacterium]|nr:Gfo/Idh/MocA family oxidoreductase [Tepidisphaeraceae bacterium]